MQSSVAHRHGPHHLMGLFQKKSLCTPESLSPGGHRAGSEGSNNPGPSTSAWSVCVRARACVCNWGGAGELFVWGENLLNYWNSAISDDS